MATAEVDLVSKIGKVAIGCGMTVVGLGWWLKGQFVAIKESGERRMQHHEQQDERRHRQNLVRLTRIETRLGIPVSDDVNGVET